MKISVIVATYDNPCALEKSLEGFLRQTRPPDEIITADDGSGARTRELIAGFAAKASFPILHIWQENAGFRAAKIRNEAIKKTLADYIILMDGDCVPNKHFISDHLDMSEQGFFVQGKRILLARKASGNFSAENSDSIPYLLGLALKGRMSNTHHILRMPWFPDFKNTKLNGIKSCNMGFFKKDFLAVNGFNEDFTGWGREDSELAVRFFKYGLKKKFHPFRTICFHLWHEHLSRKELDRNDKLLEQSLKSGSCVCRNGIQKL
ncbi:MAG: glycosyltransferase family 2 protein [Elusimicrobia bacterium]|nr:glycosyltransferase family 2 protein [Elusimicrobiota bacterium]